MIDNGTTRFIEEYAETAGAPMFLAGFFRSPPKNYHRSEKVTVDVMRDDEDVAIAVPSISSKAHENEDTLFTNKGFTPPIFKEAGTVNAFKLLQRRAGRNPFEDPGFLRDARSEVSVSMGKLQRKIRRAVELMASQVLATGAIHLRNPNGNTVYEEDFKAKATHIVTVGVTWAEDGETGNPLGDIAQLAKVARRDGKKQPKKLLFGDGALQRFLANKEVLARLDNRGMSVGAIAPVVRGEGATFHGWVHIGHYRFEIWSYDGFYRDPQTLEHVEYIHPSDMLMLSEGARLDLTFGAIPMIRSPEGPAASFLPSRISVPDAGLDVILNAWFSENGETLHYSVGARPLTIPTALDTFARLRVVVG